MVGLNEMVQHNKKLAEENVRLQAKVDEEFEKREQLQDSWEIAMGNLMRKYNDDVNTKDSKIFSLEEQNAKLKASSKAVLPLYDTSIYHSYHIK